MTTIFEEEILSQGAILAARTQRGQQQANVAAKRWRHVPYALAAARGSSDNAAMFFQYLAGRELGLIVALATPSLFHDGSPLRLHEAGVLAISQSGKSPGMVEVLRVARQQGCPTTVLTNDVDSALALEADSVLELFAGAERAIASTKTFTSSAHALAQFVAALKEGPLDGLEAVPGVVERCARWALASELPTALFGGERGLTVVGRGIGYATAAEISLKIREVTGIRSEAFSAPDFLHGPIGADGEGATLLVVVTDELDDDVVSSLIEQCARRGMKTVALRPSERIARNADAEIVFDEPSANWVVGLCGVIVGQVLALRIGELRGRPIDTSPGLNKVTLIA